MIGGTRIQMPELLVGEGRCSVAGALILIIALAAVTSLMPLVFTNLTMGAPAAVATIASTVTSSIAAIAAVPVISSTVLASLTAGALPEASLDRAVLPLWCTAHGAAATRRAVVVRAPGIGGVDRARREVCGG